jgi:hypothetical protein
LKQTLWLCTVAVSPWQELGLQGILVWYHVTWRSNEKHRSKKRTMSL